MLINYALLDAFNYSVSDYFVFLYRFAKQLSCEKHLRDLRSPRPIKANPEPCIMSETKPNLGAFEKPSINV